MKGLFLDKRKDLAFGKKRIAKETEYKYNLSKLAQKFLPNEEDRLIYKTMEKIYGIHPLSTMDPLMYKRGGIRQSNRKKEFAEWGNISFKELKELKINIPNKIIKNKTALISLEVERNLNFKPKMAYKIQLICQCQGW